MRARPGAPAIGGASAVLLALALAFGGCGGGVASLSFPTPPATTPTATTAPAPPADYAGVREPGVDGAPTTTLPAIGPGTATIDGTIVGPSGPVAGATVQAERIVDRRTALTQATTAADGSFSIGGVLGGVYRVRAWQPPVLALTTPDVFFLGAGQTQALTLTLQSYSGVQIVGATAPPALEVGDPANLVVSVTQQVVAADGVVRPTPMSDQSVAVDGGAGWDVTGADPAATDGQGRVAFALSCASAPAGPLVAVVIGAPPATLGAPSCTAPPATTTTTATTTTAPTTTTTTTAPTTTAPTTTAPTATTAPTTTTTAPTTTAPTAGSTRTP